METSKRGINYLDFWKLSSPPFELQADSRFFYKSRTHGEALARMLYLVSDKGMGMGVLTGEIGSGKTLIIRMLRDRVARDRYQVVYVPTAGYPFENLLEEILYQITGQQGDLNPSSSYRLMKQLEDLLHSRIEKLGRHLLIILDEAQLLSGECIEEIKCLTNLNQDKKLVSVILAGQPELWDSIKNMPQVAQRIGMYYHLNNLSEDEIIEYIRHRLDVAGADDSDCFEDGSEKLIYDFSHGCPRQINKICKLVVDRSCLLKRKKVGIDMVEMIIDDVRKHFEM